MDLEQLKNNWNEHNDLLQKNLEVNEKLLMEMKLDKVKGAIQRPYIAEVLALILAAIMALLWTKQIPSFFNHTLYFVMSITVLLVLIAGMAIAWVKIKAIKEIDLHELNVLSAQDRLARFKKTVKKMSYYEKGAIAVLLGCFPVIFKVLKGKDLLEMSNTTSILIYLGVVFTLTISLSLWLIPKWYYGQIKEANERLKEIEDFKKEK